MKPFDKSADHFASFKKQAEFVKEHNVVGWLAEQKEKISFGSRNGKFYGMDSDAVISLASDGSVEVTEFGVAPISYEGKFETDDSGIIQVALKDYPGEWPEMYLFRNNLDALLMRRDQKSSFHLGGQGGATESSDMMPYWPFRYSNNKR